MRQRVLRHPFSRRYSRRFAGSLSLRIGGGLGRLSCARLHRCIVWHGYLYAHWRVRHCFFRIIPLRAHCPAWRIYKTRASQFETTRILDRNGNLLYEILDPSAGRRTYVTLDKISPVLVAATIATEDKDFYNHPGFDPWAIIRALWENYRTGGQGGGASTITQQLARALLLSPEERAERTYSRKAREIILAAEITRRYSKDEILELYLNEIYYGNLAYGIEAAVRDLFRLRPPINSRLLKLPSWPGFRNLPLCMIFTPTAM